MAQLNLIKLINLPKRLSLQKPLTQFKASPPHPSPTHGSQIRHLS